MLGESGGRGGFSLRVFGFDRRVQRRRCAGNPRVWLVQSDPVLAPEWSGLGLFSAGLGLSRACRRGLLSPQEPVSGLCLCRLCFVLSVLASALLSGWRARCWEHSVFEPDRASAGIVPFAFDQLCPVLPLGHLPSSVAGGLGYDAGSVG